MYLYDTSVAGGQLLKKFEHRAPVLDACFGEDDNEAYTAGLDWDVRRFAPLLLGQNDNSLCVKVSISLPALKPFSPPTTQV